MLYYGPKMVSFPSPFTFGIAESDLQTVGSFHPQKHEQAHVTMWERFAERTGIDAPAYGSHKYSRAAEDADLITGLGVKGYRTSVSMSRTLLPDGSPNEKAFAWYRDYLSRIKDKGVAIHLCLYHWEAPDTFAREGILSEGFTEWFLKHTDAVVDRLGDLVDFYIPINELWCITYLAHYRGIHAPGDRDIARYWKAYFAAISLQTRIIEHLGKRAPRTPIGIVNIHFPAYLRPEHAHDAGYQRARAIADALSNTIYSDPFFTGTIDPLITETFGSHFPQGYASLLSRARCADVLDYYGVNYYNSMYVRPSDDPIGYALDDPDTALRNSLGWVVSVPPLYPRGLEELLVGYGQRYAGYGLKNIIVSENGTPARTDLVPGSVADDWFRIYFLDEHISQVHAAIAKGAPVRGYFLWTLLDNYEWQEGYRPDGAFGLVGVDRETGDRYPKRSYAWYRDLITQLS